MSRCQLRNACQGPSIVVSGSRTLSPVILTSLEGRYHDSHFKNKVTETHGVKKPAHGMQKQVVGQESSLGSPTGLILHQTPSF